MIPLLHVAFLSLFLAPENTGISKFAVAIGTVRALRQVNIRLHLKLILKIFCVNICVNSGPMCVCMARYKTTNMRGILENL